MAIIAITTSSSISVNPRDVRDLMAGGKAVVMGLLTRTATQSHHQKLTGNVIIMPYNGIIMTNPEFSSNRVRERRIAHGLTQSDLAQRVGISRTAITAIEGGKTVPSVATALLLATELKCIVEELFGTASVASESSSWAWRHPSGSSRFWQAEVFGRVLKYPALSTPLMTPPPDNLSHESAASVAGDTLVLACCDPAAGLLASQFHTVTGMRMIVISRSSSQSIEMLKEGVVHLAGLHFSTEEHPERNVEIVRDRLGSNFELIRLSQWQEGIALATDSSHRTVRSALSAKLTWIGREDGSGARHCLNKLLNGRQMPRRSAQNHQGVAAAVQSGWADAGICVRLVSEEAGLRFLPVQEEAFDVCYPKAFAGDRRLKAFVKVVRSLAYRRLLSDLPGYNTSETGNLVGAC